MSVHSRASRWLATGGAPAAALLLAAGLCHAADAVAQPVAIESRLLALSSWSDLIDAAMMRRAADASSDTLRASAAAQASMADRAIAGSWESDLSVRQDRVGSGSGYREVEGGIGAVLWRPGERDAVRGQAGALTALADARTAVARLEIAGDVRRAWWSLAEARAEVSTASEQLGLARELVAATSRMVEAGQQARLDLLQAQGELASAEGALALASGREAEARAVLVGLLGAVPARLPAEVAGTLPVEEHPVVRAALAEATQIAEAARLARVQGEPGWRVGVDVRSERDATGRASRSSTGVRVSRPLGRDPAAGVLVAELEAEASAARRRVEAARHLIEAGRAEAAARLAAARAGLTAAQARTAAADDVLALTDRGWREGELSFLELIQARAAAAAAARSMAVAAVAVDAAVSAFNQAQGLLPQDAPR